ncbi:facilitated trehalose transporter Tret1-like isoform X1 [Manduca sexta]|uniref:facilitated trehalose transporter Tret1-like isoform X1 n=1 Tax=Manduca sexta TaxID=7130 RepID=UPI00188F89A9|nr:facilitated trehalose transporter Tret1-like isoform X1 [Manduca sexta]
MISYVYANVVIDCKSVLICGVYFCFIFCYLSSISILFYLSCDTVFNYRCIYYSKYIVFNVGTKSVVNFSVNIGHILVGYEIYWTGPIIPKLLNIEETPLSRVISATEASWVASLVLIGGDVGAIIAGYTANLIGRRPCIILSGVLMLISHLIVNFPTSLGMIYAGRICIGASITIFLLVTFIYLGEISSPNIRGMLMTSTSIFHSFGGFVVYCVGPYVSYTQVGYVFFGISAVYVTASCFLPESPVYHVIKGNEEAAKESLHKLGRDKDIDTELKKMMEQAVKTKTNSYLLRELFIDKGNRRALCVTTLYTYSSNQVET